MNRRLVYWVAICTLFVFGITALRYFEMSDALEVDEKQLGNSNLLYTATAKSGFSPWVVIRLYDDGLLEIFASRFSPYYDYHGEDAEEYKMFSDKIPSNKFEELKLQISNLPECRNEVLTNSDAWVVYTECDGQIIHFNLWSMNNQESVRLIEEIINMSIGDLNASLNVPILFEEAYETWQAQQNGHTTSQTPN